jgi:thioredoxin-related protein
MGLGDSPTLRAVGIILAVVLGLSPARAEMAPLGDDGLYHQSWFHLSLLDLRDDVAEATSGGKHLAVVWEQKGCSYCRQMHERHLADPEIAGYIREHFLVIQLDLHGGRSVTDFDGETLSESQFAKKYAIRLTPTIQFFPQIVTGAGAKIEAARMPGLLEPADFLSMFRRVAEGAR